MDSGPKPLHHTVSPLFIGVHYSGDTGASLSLSSRWCSSALQTVAELHWSDVTAGGSSSPEKHSEM